MSGALYYLAKHKFSARYGVILREKKAIKQFEYCTGAGVDTEEVSQF